MSDPQPADDDSLSDTIGLWCISGQLRGTAEHFSNSFLIGKDPSNHLCPRDDALLSRFHAFVSRDPEDAWTVRDLNSRSGTWVNGTRIDRDTKLQEGDLLRCGECEFHARFGRPARVTHSTGSVIYSEISPVTDEDVQFPGYKILRTIGEGGMGVVYHALEAASGREVAIKAIRADFANNGGAIRRFLREIAALLQLRHPRIVEFIEAGSTEESTFLVMEYVERISLHKELSGRALKQRVRVATGLMLQVLDALDYAHQRGWLHRDLKPENVLIQAEGRKWRAKVSDFGLAKNLERAGLSCVTSEGQSLGSLPYMAPEQAGAARDVTFAADLFSAGATLYQWLSQHGPREFPKGRPALEVVAESVIVPIEQRLPELPPALCQIVNRSLAKQPADRFRSAMHMREELARVRNEY